MGATVIWSRPNLQFFDAVSVEMWLSRPLRWSRQLFLHGAKIVEAQLLKLDAGFFRDCLAARQNRDVLYYSLSSETGRVGESAKS